MLAGDPDLRKYLPIDPNSMNVFEAVKEGVLLCKLINKIRPGTISERSICTKENKNTFEIAQNHIAAIEAATKLGLKVINIGPSDLMAGTPHLILGLLWQVIRMGIMDKVSIHSHPEMIALLEEGEDVSTFVNLAPEETLLRWFNHHLKRAGHPRRVANFSGDLADSENYLVLLNQLSPQQCGLQGLQERDLNRRAELMLQNADRLGCRKFLSPSDVVHGNAKLNLLFVGNLFNEHVCLEDDRRDALEKQRLQREAEDAYQRKLAEEEARRKEEWAREEAAWRRRMAEEEEKMRRDIDSRRAQLEAEAEAHRRRIQQEEEARRKKFEEEERARQARYAEEDRRREEEWRKKMQDEAERQRAEAERRRIEEERRRQEEARKREEEARRKQFEEQQRLAALQQQYAAEERAKKEWAEQQARMQQWQAQQQAQAAWEAQQAQAAWEWQQQQALLAQQQAMYQQVTTTTTTTHTQAIQRLYLTVAEARNLKRSDLLGLGKPDPYCVLQLREQRFQTRKERATTNPVWHQEFEIGYFGPNDELSISVFDRDRFSKDDFLGQVVLRRKDLVDGTRRWFPLQARPGVGDRVRGELFLQFRHG